MLQACEGYLEKGKVYPLSPLTGIQGRYRVIITILDEQMEKRFDTWAELDEVVSGMGEKPRLEDYPRCKLGRELINFEEVV